MSRTSRAIADVTVVVSLGAALAGLIVRAQPVTDFLRLVFAVGAPYLVLVALLGLMLAVGTRRRILTVVAVALVIATLTVQVSWYYLGRSRDVGQHVAIRVLSSNIYKGQTDAASFVDLASRSADVITVAELTPEAVGHFKAAGLDRVFPHSLLFPAAGAGGIGMWSRYPITPVSVPRHRFVLMPAVRLHVPGLEFHPLLASTHVMSPVAGDENTVDDWRQGMAGAKAQLDGFATDAGPAAVIIGGDYNSTPDLRQFRDLLTNGYRDAVEQTGAGFAPTYPADTWYPPVITIDHVLTRNAAAASVRTIDIEGSDHRAVLATVNVPVVAGAS